jgi:hypothetical protein
VKVFWRKGEYWIDRAGGRFYLCRNGHHGGDLYEVNDYGTLYGARIHGERAVREERSEGAEDRRRRLWREAIGLG